MLKKWWAELDLKRLAVLVVGPGLLALGVDAWISHFAGKDEGSAPAQYIPVYYAPIATVLAIAWAFPKLKPKLFQVGMMVLGITAIAIGLLGTVLHFVPLWKDLSDEKMSWEAIQGALSLAPPVFAPLGFAGVGGLLLVLSHPRLMINLLPKNAALEASQRTGAGSAKERAA
jgi:hypothetical protein